jgi:hypothetical protein
MADLFGAAPVFAAPAGLVESAVITFAMLSRSMKSSRCHRFGEVLDVGSEDAIGVEWPDE